MKHFITHLQHNLLRFGLVLVVILVLPIPALAHEKWFVVDGHSYPPHLDLLFTLPVLLMIGLACIGVASLFVIRYLVGDDNRFPQIGFLRYYDRSNRAILAVQTAISLVAFAVMSHLFVPSLAGPSLIVNMVFAATEIFIAFSFISGLLTRVGALVLLGLFAVSFFFFPAWEVLEQSIFAGIAFYLLIMGRGLTKVGSPREPLAGLSRYWWLAPRLLSIGAGLSIAVCAFTEKLLDPELALAFLSTHPTFNVVHLLGVSNAWFILLAGAAELTIGLGLISGALPRLVALGMLIPFNMALPFLPVTELLGHLPFFAVMYVLLFLPPAKVQMIDALYAGQEPEVLDIEQPQSTDLMLKT